MVLGFNQYILVVMFLDWCKYDALSRSSNLRLVKLPLEKVGHFPCGRDRDESFGRLYLYMLDLSEPGADQAKVLS